MSAKKRIITKSPAQSNLVKPDTATRAGITAQLKFTRGKQLVEHNPFDLIPDPQNPRPGEIINDEWLISNLKIGTEQSLCKLLPDNSYFIPEISEILSEYNEQLEQDYNFLRGLAHSIRFDGLIEPIEIFLADRENDPEYFTSSPKDFGYVVLEGHQRRMAAMLAGVPAVTCVEITDETTLAKLKIRHRKLRRQLSENNLRKDLTVPQNFKIAQALLSEDLNKDISAVELSSIMGLHVKITEALLKIISRMDSYPASMFKKIEGNHVSFNQLKRWAYKTAEEIELEIKEGVQKKIKPRGRAGGAIKKSATFKIKKPDESVQLHKFLLSRFPEIAEDKPDFSFGGLEKLLSKIKEIAMQES